MSKACSGSIRQFQNHDVNNLVESRNLGAFYKYVNTDLNGSNGITPLRDRIGYLIMSNTDKVASNNNFCSVFTVDDGVIDPSKLTSSASSTVAPPFTTPILRNISTYLKPKMGVDPTVSQLSSFKTQLALFHIRYRFV